MKRSLAILGVAAALAIAVAGCGSGSSSSSTSSGVAAGSGGSTSTATGSTSTPTPSTSTTPSGGGSAPSGTSGSGSTRSSNPSAGSGSTTTTTTTPTSGGDNSIQTYGSAAQGTDKAAVVDAMRSYMRALAVPDYAKVCTEISSENRRVLMQFLKFKHTKAKSCATLLPTLLSPQTAAARKAANGRITGVRIKGPHAFVLFRPAGGPPSYFVMLKEAGAWKATSLAAGSPLNPTLPGR